MDIGNLVYDHPDRGNDELQMRSFWRRWQSLVADLPYVEQYEHGLTPGEIPEVAPSSELTAADRLTPAQSPSSRNPRRPSAFIL